LATARLRRRPGVVGHCRYPKGSPGGPLRQRPRASRTPTTVARFSWPPRCSSTATGHRRGHVCPFGWRERAEPGDVGVAVRVLTAGG